MGWFARIKQAITGKVTPRPVTEWAMNLALSKMWQAEEVTEVSNV